jgi:N-acetylglucosaminyldiphosphoundecaprenol N-acetyl-beta-D-mannosaminyltransferase
LDKNKVGRSIHFLNSYNLGLMIKDHGYFDLIKNSYLSIVDGKIFGYTVMFWSRIRKINQIRGIDFMRLCLENDENNEPYFQSHFFLGGTRETLRLIEEEIKSKLPHLDANYYSPPFSPLSEIDTELLVAQIKRAKPDVVWVGLGTPKQDYVVSALSKSLNTPVVAVGAAFDFLAGTKSESPKRLQVLGLEWLHRLISEPKRLWKRYLLFSPLVFIYPIFILIKMHEAHSPSES